MLAKSDAIVLSIIPYKEKNLIVNTYSKNTGIQSFFISRPANNSKKQSKNNFQLFSVLEITYNENKKSNLPRVKETKYLHLLLSIRTDVAKSAMVYLLSEILLKSIKEEEANPSLYDFILQQILQLENCTDNFANFHLYFITQLTQQLGIAPAVRSESQYFDVKEGSFCHQIPKHPHYLNAKDADLFKCLLTKNWKEIQTLKLTGERRFSFLGELLKYYEYHIPGFESPKSLSVLNEVFNS